MIKHLLILTTYGQIFYSQEFIETEETVDVALTGGLLSAIYSMASETQREKISEFELVTSRIIFKEERNELLFVLTVDKRMDVGDTNELLDMIAKRFFERYGEIQIDGLVLTEFEEDVTEIVNKKLWYLGTKNNRFRFWDYAATFLTTFILCWYSYLAFNIPNFIWSPLLARLNDPLSFLLYLLLLIGVIAIPAIALYYLVKHSRVKDILRFAKDYLSRPTRASYAELLPNYFLVTLFVSFALYFSFMLFGKGFFSEIKAFPIYPGSLLGPNYANEISLKNLSLEALASSDIPDQLLLGAITWVTWVFIFPLVYSLMLGEQKWKSIYRNAVFIASLTILIMLACLTIGGVKYLQATGFDPKNININALTYQLAVIFPLNIFFYGFLLFLGVGINRITPPKTRVPSLLAIGLSIYFTLVIQRVLFWLWVGPA